MNSNEKLNLKFPLIVKPSKMDNSIGITTKSLKSLIDYGYMEFDIDKIEYRCAAENKKSNDMALRLGFKLNTVKKDGENLYGILFDRNIYELSKEEYLDIDI